MRPKTILPSMLAVLVVVSFFACQEAEKPAMEAKSEADKQLTEIRENLAQVKRKLTADGKYSCCIDPSCDFCALGVGKCPCGENVAKGMPVCGTCAGGWAAGYGQIADVDPAKVEAISGDMAKMMYNMRAKHAGIKMKK